MTVLRLPLHDPFLRVYMYNILLFTSDTVQTCALLWTFAYAFFFFTSLQADMPLIDIVSPSCSPAGFVSIVCTKSEVSAYCLFSLLLPSSALSRSIYLKLRDPCVSEE